MTFFIAVGTLCAICGTLAALLVLAGTYLTDYGICKIVINDGEREIDVEGGGKLLEALMRERIFIPSACGGGGSCGLCKLRILSGAGPVLPTEEPHLTEEEKKRQVRLSCQVKVREDLHIEVPEELFKIQQFDAVVTAMEALTHDITLLRLELIDPETIAYVPGQYMQVCAPVYPGNPEPVYRAYSIASDPRDTRHLDFIIRLVPNGICTTWVFEHLQVGERVQMNGPHGEFRLQTSEREAIFIAGGSGMAPFRCILHDMKHRQDARTCRYFFGAVSGRDMFGLDDMKTFEQTLPDFRFIPALSGPTTEDKWDGEAGLITEVVARHYPDVSDKEAYLCGSPGMIDACIKVLIERGLEQDSIFYDKFA